MERIFKGVNEYRLVGKNDKGHIDWWIVFCIIPLSLAGLVTMNSFTGESTFGSHQLVWIVVSFVAFLIISSVDVHFLRLTSVSIIIYLLAFGSLLILAIIGQASNGAISWFDLGFFSFQPADLSKLALIIVLAKYFSRRHIEIANVRHILVSGIYSFILFALVVAQPDFGSAMIISLIWLGMVLISGISKKHLFAMIAVGAIAFLVAWNFGFHEYQKNRIRNFINPSRDVSGAGYNAYQSTIAVGSGQLLGKGLGYGTQSRLKFLPEYQTDFVFAAFAEEWGFVGVLIVFVLFTILIWRIIRIAICGASNFEILFGAGVAIYFIVHIVINIGMNIRLLPITGTPPPFLSYGGTHLLSEFVALGVLMSMRKYSRIAHKDITSNEFVGPQ